MYRGGPHNTYRNSLLTNRCPLFSKCWGKKSLVWVFFFFRNCTRNHGITFTYIRLKHIQLTGDKIKIMKTNTFYRCPLIFSSQLVSFDSFTSWMVLKKLKVSVFYLTNRKLLECLRAVTEMWMIENTYMSKYGIMRVTNPRHLGQWDKHALSAQRFPPISI